MAEPPDPYKTLQVDPEAEDEVIQAAYRRLAQKYHPDRASGAEAIARMVAINAAWELVGEPVRRQAFDRRRLERATTGRDGSGAGDAGVGGGAAAARGHADGHHRSHAPAAAGPPPGHPSGSVLVFGRYAGWSLGEIARRDIEYVEWLDRMPIGRPYREEIDAILRRSGRRRSPAAEAAERRGLFRRR